MYNVQPTSSDSVAANANSQEKALIEINDAWDNPIDYGNPGNGNFPTPRSAGPDGVFQTADDILSTEI